MPDWSSERLRRTAHSTAVWLAWFVLTGRLSHDGTYGELRRLSPWTVAKQLLLLSFTVGFVALVAVNVPRGAVVWVGSGWVLAVAFGTLFAAGYFAVTGYADYALDE